MELFKTSTLKNKYKEFSEKLLPSILECNYCNVVSCEWHSKFTGTCTHCRQRHCRNCRMFNISKDLLLASASTETVDFLYNFICDFLNISDDSINVYFPDIKVEKKEVVYYRQRVKFEKNRNVSKWKMENKILLLMTFLSARLLYYINLNCMYNLQKAIINPFLCSCDDYSGCKKPNGVRDYCDICSLNIKHNPFENEKHIEMVNDFNNYNVNIENDDYTFRTFNRLSEFSFYKAVFHGLFIKKDTFY